MPFDKDSKQYCFVSEDLKSASENKSINWMVAYIYEMLYTSPTYHKPTDSIRDIYHHIFDKYHVSLVTACILTAETVDLIFYKQSMILSIPLALLSGTLAVVLPEAYKKTRMSSGMNRKQYR